jgi:hypothetical protein
LDASAVFDNSPDAVLSSIPAARILPFTADPVLSAAAASSVGAAVFISMPVFVLSAFSGLFHLTLRLIPSGKRSAVLWLILSVLFAKAVTDNAETDIAAAKANASNFLCFMSVYSFSGYCGSATSADAIIADPQGKNPRGKEAKDTKIIRNASYGLPQFERQKAIDFRCRG